MTDLSSELTVFLISSGEPSTAECECRLLAQDCVFRLERIENVTPMDRAFQAMLDRCETRLYVQVDADMLLERHAIRTLYEAIEAQPPDVAMFVAWLWGDAEERPIQGVKIYRHTITRQFPYVASYSCEVPQIARLQAAGFRTVAPGEPEDRSGCLGEHYSLQTPEIAFRRWRRLMSKHRKFDWMGWLGPYPSRLFDRLAADPENAALEGAVLGAIVGLYGPLPADRELDTSESDPVYDVLCEAWPLGAPVRDVASARFAGKRDALGVFCSTRSSVAFAVHMSDPEVVRASLRSLRARALVSPADSLDRCALLGAVAGLVDASEAPASAAPEIEYRRLAGYVGEYSAGPTELVLYLTDRCNFRCTWCKRQAQGSVPRHGEFSLDTTAQVLDRFPRIRNVCIAGFGEPLLYPALQGLLDLLHSRKVVVGLISNGAQLADEQIALALEVRAGKPLAYLSVSLVAPDAEGHHAITGTRTWDRVLAGVRRMTSRTMLRTGVSFVITRSNVARLPEMLALAKDLGARFVNLHSLLPHDGVRSANWLAEIITTESFDALATLDMARSVPGAELVETWPVPIDLKSSPHRCMSPFAVIGVDAGGVVTGCRRVTPPALANGHVDRPGLWLSPYFTDLRRKVLGDVPSGRGHVACDGCLGQWRG